MPSLKNNPHLKTFTLTLALLGVLLTCGTALARSGCCSGHGGVSGCVCADGTSLSATCAPYYPGCVQPSSKSSSSRSLVSTKELPTKKTQTAKCTVNGALPDASCTPGAVFEDATKDKICKAGYSKSVRDVSTSTKNLVYAEYGVSSHTAATYEIDHLIPLGLGGSNDIANLFPEAADPRPGFHEKDKVENYLHSQVCSGKIALQEAQKKISTDWLGVYQSRIQNNEPRRF